MAPPTRPRLRLRWRGERILRALCDCGTGRYVNQDVRDLCLLGCLFGVCRRDQTRHSRDGGLFGVHGSGRGAARRGGGCPSGHDALRSAYDSWTPTRPQRHLVLNTVLTSWTDDSAEAVSDVVFLLKGSDGWATLLVGRYHDTLRNDDDAWRFVERVATFLD